MLNFTKPFLFTLCVLQLHAGNFYNSTNFQGFTGLINTPNAEILSDGKVEFSFSNQVDAFRERNNKDAFTAEQYFVNFGLLPNLEFSGRLSNIEDKHPTGRDFLDRDLSASVKYQIPFYNPYFPKIALGIQDIGGAADRYDAKFIVLSQKYSFVRGSIGYGFSSGHLDGLFGGIEVKTTNWCYLISEYDTQNTRVGLRLNTPKQLFHRVDLSFLANLNVEDEKEDFSFAINLKMKLGDDRDNITKIQQVKGIENINIPSAGNTEYEVTTPVISEDVFKAKLRTFEEKLIAFGFENIDIGMKGTRFYVAYENHVLEHNEIDAMGVILGYMVALDLPFENFELVVKKSDVKIRSVKGSLFLYKAFINNLSKKSAKDFKFSLEMDKYDPSVPEQLFVQNANSSYFKTRLEIAPGLFTLVATEISVLDYIVSLRPYMHWTLYKGIDLGVLADFPVLTSSNMDEDTGVYGYYNKGNQLLSVLLSRSDTFDNFINIASGGVYKEYLAGFDTLTYSNENHTLSFKAGYLNDDNQDVRTRKIYLGTYSYYDYHYDTLLSLTAGKYYDQDTGFDIKFKRFFGDTAITAFYQNTTEQTVGVGIELPLTPKRVANNRYFQIKGKNDFSYNLRTTIKDSSGQNFIRNNIALNPKLEFNANSRFLNRDRLNIYYLQKHILRLRDAYFNYVIQ